jgi:HAD superfamily hydrolase (TIGR01509 family)
MNKAIVFDLLGVIYFPGNLGYPGALNTELIDFITTLISEIDVYVFTSDTTGLEAVVEELRYVFKEVYSAKELGHSKNTSEAFIELAKRIGSNPEEITFIDDTLSNVEAANNAGLNTWQFTENSETIRKINRLF